VRDNRRLPHHEDYVWQIAAIWGKLAPACGLPCKCLRGWRMFHEPRIDFGNPGVVATILLVTFMAGVALGVVAYLASCCP
jgi:hypothetical protein